MGLGSPQRVPLPFCSFQGGAVGCAQAGQLKTAAASCLLWRWLLRNPSSGWLLLCTLLCTECLLLLPGLQQQQQPAKGLCKGAGLHLVVLKEAEMKGSLPSKGGVLCEHVIIVNLAQPDTTSWIKHNLPLTEEKLSVMDSERVGP